MSTYLSSAQKQFAYYRQLGTKTFPQVSDEDLFRMLSPESNSMAAIVKHLHGNMLSRWTGFLTEDGEKEWRQREAEFENDLGTRDAVLQAWEEGWNCLEEAIAPLTEQDLDRIIYIRNQGHTVQEAINRQMSHYAYHVGQIVFLGRLFAGSSWQSLSIPRGQSAQFNARKFREKKKRGHFTDDFLEK